MSAGEMPKIDRRWTQRQIQNRLSRILNPAVCSRLLVILNDPNADFSDVAQVLQGDPMITAKLLALANTIQGQDRKLIDSTQRAVQVLGMRNMYALVMAILLTACANEPLQPPRRHDLWRWVLACGVAGDWLARELQPGDAAPDEGSDPEHLVYGLLMNLGALILSAGLGETYQTILGESFDPLALPTREGDTLGVNHYQVTLWALSSLHCPDILGQYARLLATTTQDDHRIVARIVEILGAKVAGYNTGGTEAWLMDALPRLGLDPLALDDTWLPQMQTMLGKLYDALAFGDINHAPAQSIDPADLMIEAGNEMQQLLLDKLNSTENNSRSLHAEAMEVLANHEAVIMAESDPLTHLPNRRGWLRGLEQLRKSAKPPLFLILTDVDHFKRINDIQGHAQGDQALVRLSNLLRHRDPKPLLTARMGGDEFLAIYPVVDQAHADRQAAAILDAARNPTPGQCAFALSIGGHLLESIEELQNWDTLYRIIDARLYRAKAQGRDRAITQDHDAKAAS